MLSYIGLLLVVIVLSVYITVYICDIFSQLKNPHIHNMQIKLTKLI